MPYALSRCGWFLGIITTFVIAAINMYAMILLIDTRKHLEKKGHKDIFGYGDVGRIISGRMGEKFVNICLVISQVGYATAYIIFIAANVESITDGRIKRSVVCASCVPVLACLVQVQDMKKLSPFSLLADFSNALGFAAVLFQDYRNFYYNHPDIVAINYSQAIYMASVSIYTMEGVGLILPLESSYIDRHHFPSLLKKCIFGITVFMAIFGCAGYVAFGDHTLAPITLNLSESLWAIFVKFTLCLGIYLTYPVMLFPVNDVMENMFLAEGPRPNRWFRAFVVMTSAFVAYKMPDFGKFLGLVGASIIPILGFILPCYFHLKAFQRGELGVIGRMIDYFLILFGIVFCIFGTYDAIKNLVSGDEGAGHRLLILIYDGMKDVFA